MGKRTVGELMPQAQQALLDGRWDEARQLFEQVLQITPEHFDAKNGLKRLATLESADRAARDLMLQADEQLAAGAYKEALHLYTEALNTAGNAGMRHYHDRLEKQRNLARDLDGYQRRTQATLKEADRLSGLEQWDKARIEVNQLLEVLPEDERYDSFQAALLSAREKTEQQMGDEAIYQQAVSAHKIWDCEEAIRLARTIPLGSSFYGRAQLIISEASDYLRDYIQGPLQRVEEAFRAQHWADAFAELDKMRKDAPTSPAWQRWWLQVGMTHGQEELNAGRQTNSQRDFKAAQQHFEEAERAFAKVLEVYDTHTSARVLHDEAADLVQVTIGEAQARIDWDAGRRDEARQALATAMRRIEYARSQGRDYATVTAVVSTMQQALDAELARIIEEERHLQNGRRLLRELRPDEAAAEFRATLNALLPDHRKDAEEGYKDADAVLARFNAAFKLGSEATQPSAAVDAFQKAFEYWPSGPKVATRLEAGLVRAGEAALADGEERAALDYFERALKLNPDNELAQQGKAKPGIQMQIEALLKQTGDDLARLGQQPETGADDYRALRARLQAAQPAAKPYNDLKTAVKDLLHLIDGRLKQWQAYEKYYQRAVELRDKGDWETAVKHLLDAKLALEDAAPASLDEQIGGWTAARIAVEEARKTGRSALQTAQAAYDKVPATGDFEACLAALGQVEDLVQKANEAILKTGSSVPGDLAQIERQAGELRTRVDGAFEAATTPHARDGLLKLRELMRLQGADAILIALAQRLEEQVLAEVPDLLRRAAAARDSGELTQAVELLRAAHEFKPADPDIAAQYAALQQRRRLEERLRQAETDATAKLATGSAVDAAKAWRLGLEALLEPGSGLPAEVAQLVQGLLTLADQDLGLALGQTGTWVNVQAVLGQLGRLSSQDWAARRAYQLADAWSKLAHDNALHGVRASAANMHDWQEALRAAATLMYLHPKDEKAIQDKADAEEKVIEQLVESIERRVKRAREALTGVTERAAARAMEELTSAEAEFYTPVKAAFPELVKLPKVEQAHAMVKQLRGQAETLQSLEDRVLSLLTAAEAAYVAGRSDEADGKLTELPDLKPAPLLAERVRGLQERIAAARTQTVRQAFRDVLTTAQVGLRGATTVARLDEIKDTLDKLPASNTLLQEQDRQDHFDLVGQVRKQREALAAGEMWETQAMAAKAQGDYLQAQTALEEALKVVREGGRQVDLQTKLTEVRPKAEQQQLRNSKEAQGRALFDDGQYVAARQAVLVAQRLGAPVGDLLQAVRAGILWERAQERWEQQQDGEGAQADLAEALALVEGNPDGEGIASEVQSLQKRLAREWASLLAIQDDLNTASMALASGDPKSADTKVIEVLKRAPGNAGAVALQAQIRCMYQAQTEYGKALMERDAGRYDAALTLVDVILKSILPDWPNALALRHQIEASRDAYQKLVQAENLARSRKFQQAREALEQAAELGIEPERLRQVQEKVQDLQQKWESAAFTPIEESFRDGKYAEALSRCAQALSEAASPDFQTNLTTLQTEIVTRWAEEDLRTLRDRRLKAQNDADLADIEADLESLTQRKPALPDNQTRQVEGFRREVNEQRLLKRLVAAEQQVKDNAWAAALETVTEVLEIANAQKLRHVVVKANSMKWEIEERKTQDTNQRDQAQRDQFMQEVRDLLNSPKDRADLEYAADRLREVLKIPRFQQDRESQSLLKQTEKAIKLFDDAEQALDQADEQIRLRRFKDADRAMDLPEVSPLLSDKYNRQRDVVRLLLQAEREQDQQEWAAGFTHYQHAIKQQATLAPLLQKDMDRCRERLVAKLIANTQGLLDATPPDIERADALLAQATAADWLTPISPYETTVTRIRNSITLHERVAQAAALLRQDGSDLAQAQTLLKQARTLLSPDGSDAAIFQWESLAQVIQAAQANDQAAMARHLEFIRSPLAEEPRVRRLKAQLAVAVAAQRAQDEARQRHDRAVEDACARIQGHLVARPPAYEDAVDAWVALPQTLRDDERLRELRAEMQARLEASADELGRMGQYAEAISKATLVGRLAPDDAGVQQLRESLRDKLQNELKGFISGADAAMRAFQLNRAEGLLQKAEALATPETREEIKTLRQHLERSRKLSAEIDAGLNAAEQAHVLEKWDEAVQQLQQVRLRAPDHERLMALVGQIQNDLRDKAEKQRGTGQFVEALRLCQLALGLGEQGNLDELKRQILAARDAYVASQRRQAEAALAVWDRASAEKAIQLGLAATPDDMELSRLRNRCEQVVTATPEVERAMAAGWEALRKREYRAGRQAFEQAQGASRLVGLSEAEAWIAYITNLEAAVDGIHSGQMASFQKALEALEQAMTAVWMKPGDCIPIILPNTREWRRQAAWDAVQLARIAAKLIQLENDYAAAETLNKRSYMFQIEEQQQAFLTLLQRPTTPGKEFRAEGPPMETSFKSVTSEGKPDWPASPRPGHRTSEAQPSVHPASEPKEQKPTEMVAVDSLHADGQAGKPASKPSTVAERVAQPQRPAQRTTRAVDIATESGALKAANASAESESVPVVESAKPSLKNKVAEPPPTPPATDSDDPPLVLSSWSGGLAGFTVRSYESEEESKQ